MEALWLLRQAAMVEDGRANRLEVVGESSEPGLASAPSCMGINNTSRVRRIIIIITPEAGSPDGTGIAEVGDVNVYQHMKTILFFLISFGAAMAVQAQDRVGIFSFVAEVTSRPANLEALDALLKVRPSAGFTR